MYESLFSELREQVERERNEKVNRFFRVLEELYGLAEDPDLAPYAARLPKFLPQFRYRDVGDVAAAVIKPAASHGGAPTNEQKNGKGIREAIRNLPLPAQFTTEDILGILEANSFEFASTDHKASVRDAVNKLATGGDGAEFRVVRPRAGAVPNLYERIRR